jgi:hypothetical protein
MLGMCQTALAYYEAAAHGVMDELKERTDKGQGGEWGGGRRETG